MIYRTPFFLPWLYGNLIWRIPTTGKEIYLTFDDGPVQGVTEWVLEELQKVDARATFFCIGDNICKHRVVFQKVVDAGHAIGNHTFNHIKGWTCPTLGYLENTRLCQEEIRSAGSADESQLLFRPPYGRIKRSQIKALSGYKIIMWDVLSFDYSKRTSEQNCLNGSIRATRPGSIVVFHDSLKAERNLKFTLPRYLKHFADLGYSFKAISNV